MAWTQSTAVERRTEVLEGIIDDEIVIYSISSGEAIGLSGTSAWIWRAIGDGTDLRNLVRVACIEFNAPRSVCAPDIASTLESLRARGFVSAE